MTTLQTAEQHAPSIIKKLCTLGWLKNILININFPDVTPESVKGVQVVKQGLCSMRDALTEWRNPPGASYYWIDGAVRDNTPTELATDLDAINQDAIAITPLHLNLTHGKNIKNTFSGF